MLDKDPPRAGRRRGTDAPRRDQSDTGQKIAPAAGCVHFNLEIGSSMGLLPARGEGGCYTRNACLAAVPGAFRTRFCALHGRTPRMDARFGRGQRADPSAPTAARNAGRAARLGIATLLVAATGGLLWASIVRVGEHERVFRCTIGGVPVRLAPGTQMDIPLLQGLQRVPEGQQSASSA